ncbi:MAG: HlyD family efflux transporter periplasmic adaptor subunit [Myxococcota bacterium]|nr:HlyD family efflux transporter periplasmic adaptor subunit [Myxococcota bacterium]
MARALKQRNRRLVGEPARQVRARCWAVLAVGLALGGSLACGDDGVVPAARAAETKDVERVSLVSLARLEPSSRVVNVAAPSSDVIQQILVKEGNRVSTDEVLVLLGSYALRAAELDAARISLERARLEPLEVEAQQARVRAVEAELDYAREEVDSQEGLSRKGFSAGKEFRDAQLQVRRAEERLREGKALLERRTANVDLVLREAQNQVLQAEARLAQSMIKAPLDGRVLRILMKEGERVDMNPVLSIGATENMVAVAEVHANEIRLVKIGQRATFTSAALPQPLEGTVESIGEMIFSNSVTGEDPTAPRGLRIVQVRILLSQDELAERLTNLEGQLRIHLGSPPGAP